MINTNSYFPKSISRNVRAFVLSNLHKDPEMKKSQLSAHKLHLRPLSVFGAQEPWQVEAASPHTVLISGAALTSNSFPPLKHIQT